MPEHTRKTRQTGHFTYAYLRLGSLELRALYDEALRLCICGHVRRAAVERGPAAVIAGSPQYTSAQPACRSIIVRRPVDK